MKMRHNMSYSLIASHMRLPSGRSVEHCVDSVLKALGWAYPQHHGSAAELAMRSMPCVNQLFTMLVCMLALTALHEPLCVGRFCDSSWESRKTSTLWCLTEDICT